MVTDSDIVPLVRSACEIMPETWKANGVFTDADTFGRLVQKPQLRAQEFCINLKYRDCGSQCPIDFQVSQDRETSAQVPPSATFILNAAESRQ